jgi:hypothetical protein
VRRHPHFSQATMPPRSVLRAVTQKRKGCGAHPETIKELIAPRSVLREFLRRPGATRFAPRKAGGVRRFPTVRLPSPCRGRIASGCALIQELDASRSRHGHLNVADSRSSEAHGELLKPRRIILRNESGDCKRFLGGNSESLAAEKK